MTISKTRGPVNGVYSNDAFNVRDDDLEVPPCDYDDHVPPSVEQRDDTTDSVLRENSYVTVDDGRPNSRLSTSSSPGGSAAGCGKEMRKTSRRARQFFQRHWTKIKVAIYIVFIAGYSAYFGYALYYEQLEGEPAIRLLWVTMTVVVCFIICIVQDNFGDQIYDSVLKPIEKFLVKHRRIFTVGLIILIAVGYLLFLILDVALSQPYNLVSFGGFVMFIFLMYLYSANRHAISWRPVIGGLVLQFVFALLVLRTTAGYDAFKWLGDRFQEFMEYSDAGSEFVFGENFADHFFAFKVLPVIIYFSSVISILYYLGVMQVIILKIAWVMQKTMGTTPGESVNAAGNIFVGMTEAPLLIRPLMDKMTSSELHAVITGGYGTIAGSVMATYIAFGVPANHLISASIMAAPCALALSKLCYPETEKRDDDDVVATMEKSPEKNVVEAAATGAINAIPLVANVAANLIAFIALLAFINATLAWFGQRAGLYDPELTFEFICSYALWPVAFMMGIVDVDCRKVAELIGVKIFLNEFVAYTELSTLIDNTNTYNDYCYRHGVPGNCNITNIGDDIYLPVTNTTLVGGILQARSIVISTYALCGFANFSAIGIVLGGLTAMVPHRRSEIARLANRALLVGIVVSFMNACTAGLLFQGDV